MPIAYWNAFVEENLRLAAFVTTTGVDNKGNQFYYINNAVSAAVNGETPFDYNK